MIKGKIGEFIERYDHLSRLVGLLPDEYSKFDRTKIKIGSYIGLPRTIEALSGYFTGLQIFKKAIEKGGQSNLSKDAFIGVEFVDREGNKRRIIDLALDLEEAGDLYEGERVVGFSFGLCVTDIYRRRIPLDKIECIISSTRFIDLDPEKIFEIYKETLEHYIPKNLNQEDTEKEFDYMKSIIAHIVENGLLYQPRMELRNSRSSINISSGNWLVSVPDLDTNNHGYKEINTNQPIG